MPVTVVQAPNEMVIPAYSDIIFTTKSSQAGTLSEMLAARYKFVCDVYINSEKKARLKVSPNQNKIGVFDISKVVQDYVQETRKAGVQSKFEDAIVNHPVHNTDRYSRNDNTIVQVEVLFGEEYVFLDQLTLFNGLTGFAGDPTITVKNGPVANEDSRYFYKIFNGCTQFTEGFEAFAVDKYINNNSSDLLFTAFPNYTDSGLSQKVHLKDYHSMARFDAQSSNDAIVTLDGDTTISSSGRRVRIKQYNSSDTLLATTDYAISEANGAAAIEGEFTTIGRTPMNFLFFGIGPKNIANAGVYQADTSYYDVQIVTSAGVAKSKVYRYTLQENDCKGFEKIRLCWLNSFGAWDYYNFTKRSTRVTNVGRNLYRKLAGGWQEASETVNWTYNTFEGGKGAYSVDATKTIEANTDYITETEATFLEGLFTSPSVMFLDGTETWVTASVTESSYTKQTSANDMLIQYLISIELGHKTVVQNT